MLTWANIMYRYSTETKDQNSDRDGMFSCYWKSYGRMSLYETSVSESNVSWGNLGLSLGVSPFVKNETRPTSLALPMLISY